MQTTFGLMAGNKYNPTFYICVQLFRCLYIPSALVRWYLGFTQAHTYVEIHMQPYVMRLTSSSQTVLLPPTSDKLPLTLHILYYVHMYDSVYGISMYIYSVCDCLANISLNEKNPHYSPPNATCWNMRVMLLTRAVNSWFPRTGVPFVPHNSFVLMFVADVASTLCGQPSKRVSGGCVRCRHLSRHRRHDGRLTATCPILTRLYVDRAVCNHTAVPHFGIGDLNRNLCRVRVSVLWRDSGNRRGGHVPFYVDRISLNVDIITCARAPPTSSPHRQHATGTQFNV